MPLFQVSKKSSYFVGGNESNRAKRYFQRNLSGGSKFPLVGQGLGWGSNYTPQIKHLEP